MQLRISRQQRQERKSVIFSVWCRLEISEQEKGLITTYDSLDARVTNKPVVDKHGSSFTIPVNLKDLMQGVSYESSNVNEVLAFERTVQKNCESFQANLLLKSLWSGEMVVDFLASVDNSEDPSKTPH